MRLSSKKQSRETNIELSMTSMIDVVFLLLIFFIITASFTKTEREVDTAVEVASESAASTADFIPIRVDVVNEGGQYLFRVGERRFTWDQHQAGELKRLLDVQPNKVDGAHVRVAGAAPWKWAAAAIQACKSANINAVSYVVEES